MKIRSTEFNFRKMNSDKTHISTKKLESKVHEVCEHEHILLGEFACEVIFFIKFLEVRMLLYWNMYLKSSGL
jgi:hypothetical protein